MSKRSERNQQMVDLRAQGQTLEAIGQQFGVTKERVRQIMGRYQMVRQFTTVPELMAQFGVSEYKVLKAVEAAGVKRPIANTDVDKVVQQITARMVRTCIICGQSFQVPLGSHKRLCSPACLLERRRQLRCEPGPMSEAMQRLHDLLAAEPPGELWVGFMDAVWLSGLTRMQMAWLRWRGIIACMPGKKHSRLGRQIMLYSARHCVVLRRAGAVREQGQACGQVAVRVEGE